ncbi:hypothetical protein ACFXAE_19725 [Streptomyces sp. NPDC059454]|uniref:hypothetical protein n=1 Tax=Streptomyces sp. NPDC059454 TaxID=3346836 RepID=UPI0036944A92
MRLTVGEHSARRVRRIVRSLLREWEMTGLSDAVEPGVTELRADVVRHVPDRRRALLLLRLPTGVRGKRPTEVTSSRVCRWSWRPTRRTGEDSHCRLR